MDQEREKVIKSFRLFDDVFMKKCFKNHKECIELVVRIVLNNNNLKFVEFKDQENINNENGKSSILDFVIVDDTGKFYDVEIESAKSNSKGYQRRARFYSSLLDTHYLSKGDDYENIPDSYVIFFCERDVIGDRKPLYEIRNTVRQTGKDFEDGRTMIFVNGEIEDDTPLGKLVRDFKLTNSKEMCYDVLKKAVEVEMIDFLLTTGRPENQILDDYLKKHEDAAVAKNNKKIAKKAIEEGYSLESISRITDIPIEELTKLKQQL